MLKINQVILFCLLTSLKLNAASKSHNQIYFTACLLLTILYKMLLNRMMYTVYVLLRKLYLQQSVHATGMSLPLLFKSQIIITNMSVSLLAVFKCKIESEM